ncbi:fungal protein [Schizosaccharomyces cryophilus OY26]|uniref:Fungal protein n=1 Tax=Schizosaccharomyces cryophilus (strain OY26 / ATCC MYA-4695 / CBS 11777 / NBRC 106824 / NRRL Y48691) TaxID=653667 RepID=S9WXF7_SCHCR|nr:uncharacterized protein SPOG_04308 [Schizosaccharomyces cryophilus OY26]EPY49342.1 fungal protein [Schizosaccharomyces cryophilus OY26]
MENDWKTKLVNLFKENADSSGLVHPEYMQLATLPSEGDKYPRNRTVAIRGFVGSGWQPSKDDPLDTDLLVFSTDLKSQKATDISLRQAKSTPTGPMHNTFELCSWLPKTMQQVRLWGQVWLYTPDLAEKNEFPKEDLLHTHLARSNKRIPQEWSWEEERRRIWENHSPNMRTSFANPVTYSEYEGEVPLIPLPATLTGREDAKLVNRWETAWNRFALVICDVHGVEFLDLNPPPGKRVIYEKHLESGQWSGERVSV